MEAYRLDANRGADQELKTRVICKFASAEGLDEGSLRSSLLHRFVFWKDSSDMHPFQTDNYLHRRANCPAHSDDIG